MKRRRCRQSGIADGMREEVIQLLVMWPWLQDAMYRIIFHFRHGDCRADG
jgi:hypothetical protein